MTRYGDRLPWLLGLPVAVLLFGIPIGLSSCGDKDATKPVVVQPSTSPSPRPTLSPTGAPPSSTPTPIPVATVIVLTSDRQASEAGDAGSFTFERTNSQGSLTVNYTVITSVDNFTATPPLTGTITFAPGEFVVSLTITPNSNDGNLTDDSIVLTLLSGVNYVVGSPRAGRIIIEDTAL